MLKYNPNFLSIFSGKHAEKEFLKRQKRFKKEDGEKIIQEEKRLFKIVQNNSNLKKSFEDFKDLFSLLKDFYEGNYKDVPLLTIASIGGTFFSMLFLSMITPPPTLYIGYLDNAAVFAVCLKFVGSDLEKYREWRESQTVEV